MNRTAHVCKGYKLSQSLLIRFPVRGGWNGTDYCSHFTDADPGAQRLERLQTCSGSWYWVQNRTPVSSLYILCSFCYVPSLELSNRACAPSFSQHVSLKPFLSAPQGPSRLALALLCLSQADFSKPHSLPSHSFYQKLCPDSCPLKGARSYTKVSRGFR